MSPPPPSRLLRHLPDALTLLRGVLGPLFLWTAWTNPAPVPSVSLLLAAGVSDSLDGPLARRLHVASERGSKLDGWADTIFGLCVGAALWHRDPADIRAFRVPLLLVAAALFPLRWAQDLLKYGRWTSYHAFSGKLWGVTLFAASLALLLAFHPAAFLRLALLTGVVCHLEGAAMTLILADWTHDVRGLPQAFRLAAQQRSEP